MDRKTCVRVPTHEPRAVPPLLTARRYGRDGLSRALVEALPVEERELVPAAALEHNLPLPYLEEAAPPKNPPANMFRMASRPIGLAKRERQAERRVLTRTSPR